jgi:superfamily II DNA/RNA helicase
LLNKFIRYLRNFCYQTGIIIVKVYGGVPLDGQIQALNEGCNILIATPRRLDYLKKGRISLKMISTLIIG